MKRVLFCIALGVGFGAYQNYSNSHHDLAVLDGQPHYELTMYSLTTCGFCKRKAEQLRKEHIAFKEHFIDENDSKRAEVTAKLERAGYPPSGYGTPIFEANGKMLPNNPKMDLIKSTLRGSLAAKAC